MLNAHRTHSANKRAFHGISYEVFFRRGVSFRRSQSMASNPCRSCPSYFSSSLLFRIMLYILTYFMCHCKCFTINLHIYRFQSFLLPTPIMARSLKSCTIEAAAAATYVIAAALSTFLAPFTSLCSR